VIVRRLWKVKAPSPLAPSLAAQTNLSTLQAQLLINRGITRKESVHDFLSPRLAHMADPFLMADMESAVRVILEAIENQEKMTVYGDYDADGLTGTALLTHFFSSLAVPVSCYVPNRLEEGYGLNAGAVRKISGNGTRLIITVDCGSSDAEEISLAKKLGMNVIVTDHHRVPGNFLARDPVLNPQRPDCPFPFKELAGVGVAFFLAVALRAELRKRGYFHTKPEPDLKSYLDLVALGTVADRVPLLDQNRMLVHSGMRIMGRSSWAGIKAIKEVSDLTSSEITSEDLAFRLAPRLNAPGRLGNSEIGLRILMTEELGRARDYALKINAANDERQNLERKILNEIENAMSGGEPSLDSRTIFIGAKGWHRGVLGIVASRLVDRYHRPSLVFNVEGGRAVGSARSIEGFNLHASLNEVEYLLERFGGHAYAAGFTMKIANLEALRRELEDLATKSLGERDLIPVLDVDAEVALEHVTPEMVNEIGTMAPFGEGNPEPVFLGRFLEVIQSRVVGNRHLKLLVRRGGKVFEAIGFGMSQWHSIEGKSIHMVFTPEVHRWQGNEKLQLRIADLERVDGCSGLILENAGSMLNVRGTENK